MVEMLDKQFSEFELRLYVECVHQDFSKEQSSNFFKSMDLRIDHDFLNILRGEYGKPPL
jgi:hypothetical protein